MKNLKPFTYFLICFFSIQSLLSQPALINKIKSKAEDKIVDQIFEGGNQKSNQQQSQQTNSGNSESTNNSSSGSGSSVKNTKGGGLSSSTPDVPQNINDASSAFSSKNYSDSRYSIRQAILGIELEMGKELLKSLPETVTSLPAIPENDKVTSTGIGFVGMTIERIYRKDDQELSLLIANNSIMVSSVNMYFNSGVQTNTEQNYKQIKFQNNKAIIEFDESSGYKLSVPFGQSSVFILQGVNFDNESKFMAAANAFIIASISQKLGEK